MSVVDNLSEDEERKAKAGSSVARAIYVLAPFSAIGMYVVLFLIWKAASLVEQATIVSSVVLSHVALLTVAYGLPRRWPWARYAGILLGASLLFAFPIGTALGGYMLFHLVLRWGVPEREAWDV